MVERKMLTMLNAMVRMTPLGQTACSLGTPCRPLGSDRVDRLGGVKAVVARSGASTQPKRSTICQLLDNGCSFVGLDRVLISSRNSTGT
jgi:hypothetical protein